MPPPALLLNIRLAWKGLLGTNTFSCCTVASLTKKKGFMTLTTGHRVVPVELRVHHHLALHDDQDDVHHIHSDFRNLSQAGEKSESNFDILSSAGPILRLRAGSF